MNFDEIIAPIPFPEFVEDYWEQQSLFSPGEASRFQNLFSANEVGALLHYLKPTPPEGMMLIKGSKHYADRWTNSDGSPNLIHVRKAVQDGYSIIVNHINKLSYPVEKFANSIQAALHHPVDVNMYLTPPDSKAFSPHWDVMDVFIIQTQGSKIWKVHKAAIDRPYPDEHSPVSEENLPELVFEEELKAGSALYIPRGHVHSATSTNSTSVHLSVGVHVLTWIDLLEAGLKGLRSDPRFRGALPPEFFNDPGIDQKFATLKHLAPESMDAEFAKGILAQKTMVERAPHPTDHFLDGSLELKQDSVLKVREGLLCRLIVGPGFAGVQYTGGKIIGPSKIQSALERVVSAKHFTVDSLCDDLGEREKKVLAERLVRDGLLEVNLQ